MTSPQITRDVLPAETEATPSDLAFLNTLAFDRFNDWMSVQLAALEIKWQHASSPKAWSGSPTRPRGR